MSDLTPTDGMREEAQRYRAWKAEGRRGGTTVAARRATQILSGEPLSEQTVITMAAWFARHEVDKQAEGFRPGEAGYPSPGRVAWAAWGGDPGQRWATAKADTIKAESERTIPMVEVQGRPYPNEHAARLKDPSQFDEFRRENDAGGAGVDFIYGIKDGVSELQAVRFDAKQHTPTQAKKWLKDNNYEAMEFEEATGDRGLTPDMSASDALLYEALEEIAEELGEFSQEKAHYMPESPFADKGMKCANCAFFEGPAACEIVKGEINAEALCKFWIIPDAKLTQSSPAPHVMSDVELRSRFKDGLVQKRQFTVSQSPKIEDDRMAFDFSSEYPVERWFGREVLSHADGAANFDRLNNSGSFLWNHNPDIVLGVVESATVGERRGKTKVRWSKNPQAQEKRRDVEDGILRNVSFLYEINEAVDMGEGGVLVTRWTPLEVSLVSIPADPTVGLRAHQITEAPPVVEQQPKAPPVAAVGSRAAEATIDVKLPPTSARIMTVETPSNAEEAVRSAVASAATAERQRVTSIAKMCNMHNMPQTLADELINNGRSLEEAQAIVLEKLGSSSRELQPAGVHTEAGALIGMDQRQIGQYRLMNVLRHLADPTSNAARDAAGFELECSAEAQKRFQRSANGVLVPFDVLIGRRDQQVGTLSKGGALVGTELLAGSFVDMLQNRSALMQSGITQINGLVGNVDIPRKTAASQHYWIGEDVDATASDVTFGLISSTPKTIAVRLPVSRRSMIQTTPDIDTIVRGDMSERLALGIDDSGLYGTGANAQPLGLKNVTGIGAVTLDGGADLVYPAILGGGTHDTGVWGNYVTMRGNAYAGNVDVASARYIMNGMTMAGCEQTLRASAAGSDYIVNDQGNIGRYPVVMSNQVKTNDVFFGDFADMVLLTWGGLDIVVDNVTQAAKGQVIFTVMQDVDWVCRRVASFSLAS